MTHGAIVRLHLDRNFGFIRGEDGQDYYFGRYAVRGLDWDSTLQERRVRFESEPAEKGPRATGVWPVD